MKKVIFVVFLLVGFSCNNQLELKEQTTIQLLDAPNELKLTVGDFLESNTRSSRIMGDSKFDISNFPVSEMKEVLISIDNQNNSVFGIPSTIDESIVLVVKLSESEEIESILFSENTLNSEGSVDTKLYNENGVLRVHFTTYNDKVIHHQVNTPVGGRTEGWFDDTGDCVSDVAQPFDNGVLNLAFDAAATYATGGWYPVVLVAACGIYAAL